MQQGHNHCFVVFTMISERQGHVEVLIASKLTADVLLASWLTPSSEGFFIHERS